MSDNSRVRVAIVGVIVIALFGALVARLWFMQMGGEEQLKFQAVARATRTVQTESPRGRILDRNGTVLVENVAEWAVTVDRQLPKSTRTRVLGQLAEVLAPQYTAEQLENNFNDLRQTPLKPAIVAVGVPEPARIAILEHIEDYPGTHVEKLTVRHYPHGELAAHVLGYTGEISEAQLATRRDAGYQEGDAIGKDGAERAFEKELRGQPRREKVEVDPTGAPVGNPLDVKPGTIGDDVALTIDANWQYAAETALAQGIASARDQQNANIKSKRFEKLKAPGGAVLAMDVTDGSIVAMASFPNYDVSSFVDGISQSEWKSLNDNPDHPLVNRATQGVYAPGSTFKLVSSIAMTQYGIRGPNDTVLDKGMVTLGKDKRASTTRATPRWAASSCRARSPARATCTSTRPAMRFGKPGTTATRSGASACRRPRTSSDSVRRRASSSTKPRARCPTPSGSRRSPTRSGPPPRRRRRTARGTPPTTSSAPSARAGWR